MHRDELSVSSATVLITGPNLADALAARSSCSRRLRTPSVRVHHAPTQLLRLLSNCCQKISARHAAPDRPRGLKENCVVLA